MNKPTEIISDVEIKDEIKKLLENRFLEVGNFYYFYYLYVEFGQVKEKTIRLRFGDYEKNKERVETPEETAFKKKITDEVVELVQDMVNDSDKIRVMVRFNQCRTDVSITE